MSGKSGPPVAAFAIVIAIVSAMSLDSGILANTPDGSARAGASVAVGQGNGGHSNVAADALGLDAGLLRNLISGPSANPLFGISAGQDEPWYPPFGAVLPAGGGPVPGVTDPAARPSATAVSNATASPHALKPPTKSVVRVATWKVAPIVTWYGPGFYGRRTACGQRYTRRIVGVASRTLPCGTLVQFRWHGITRVAPVIDRGPYASAAYVFDFSAELACDLFRERGVPNACFTRYDVQWRVVGRRRN